MILISSLISKFQILIGILFIALACLILLRIEEDPHGLAFFSSMQLGFYGVVTLTCGLALLKSKKFGLISQVVFFATSVFMYVEFFTSYTGWWA